MIMAEKKVESIKKEIERLTKSLERNSNLMNKRIDKCKQLDCNWTREEMFIHRDTSTDNQMNAWFDKFHYEREVEDIQKRLENAFKRLEKATGELERVEEKIAQDKMILEKENSWSELTRIAHEEYEKWLKQFKAECLRDGIEIEKADAHYISGKTSKGNKFAMYINEGWAERSSHSYTLRINGVVYFTSGLFNTGYRYLMNN